MKYVKVTSTKDFDLPGIKIEFEKDDNKNIEAVYFKTGDRVFRIRKASDYSKAIEVTERQDHETVEKYHLTGTLFGITVSEHHDRLTDAEARRDELQPKQNIGDTDFKIENVKVKVDEQDEVISVPF